MEPANYKPADYTMTICVDPPTKKRINAAAHKQHISMSQFIRQLFLMYEMAEIEKDEPKPSKLGGSAVTEVRNG